MRCNYAPGSRIIVTSRDMQVLKNLNADGIYEVKEMNFHESLRLFCLNSFKQKNDPAEDYAELSEKILNYAKGVPLALKVLGFLLCGRTKEAWERQLQKLDKLPENDIFKVLKLSFEGLDEEQKNIEKFPEIEETMLDGTAIAELPSSLHRLVGLEELSLYNCQNLESIPPSIGSLSKLNKLSIMYCESLETFPSSIFKLKLTKLDLHGCSMLNIFPEILEPAENFVHINLTRTAIKELTSSLEYLVGLQTLCVKLCSDLVSLPNSIVNLTHLSELDCSGCSNLTEIPNNIGGLSSLRTFSLQESNIVNLPKSITHLSSLKSLDLSDCKKLECIPQLPPSLNQLLAYDCPSVGRMMPNARLELPSIYNKDTFEFHFTNSQQLDETARSNIGAEARLRITKNAYRSVFFCFPGTAVPHWFPCRCKGRLVTMKKDSLDWPSNDRLVGFALSVVLGHMMDNDRIPISSSFTYRLIFESDGCTHILPNNDKRNS